MTKTKIYILIVSILLTTMLFGQIETKTTIYFDFNESRIDNRACKSLDSLVQHLKSFTDYSINLGGHTDSIGSNLYNDKLSLRRAIAVKSYLALKNIDTNKVKFDSYGKRKPIVPSISLSNRAFNRRVEITINVNKNTNLIDSASLSNQQNNDKTEKQKNEIPVIPYGNSIISGYNINVITNTSEMEANNFTTMTVQDSALASNLIICWEPEKNKPLPKEPLTIRVPASRNPYCKLPKVNYYDAQNDSATGLIKWNELLFPGWKSEIINGFEYFTIVINPTDRNRRCANMDCKKLYETNSSLFLVSKKYTIKQVKIIYESANALMTGYLYSRNLWTLRLWPINDVPSPTIKIKIVDKNGNEKTISTILSKLPIDKKGNYIIRKRQLKKML